MKYIKKFDTLSGQTEYLNSADIDTYVGYVDENQTVYYDDSIIIQYQKKYLTIEALTAGDLSLTGARSNFNYSLDNGSTWNVLANNQTVAVNAGKKVLLKANRPTVYYETGIGNISYSGQFNLYGNIMSLVYGDNFIGQETISDGYQFYKLFRSNTTLISAENLILPATTLKNVCYMSMFNGCTSLTVAPVLPATSLMFGCYWSMFYNCTSLTTAPELPATILAGSCYKAMFAGCRNLNYIKCLATDISASDSTQNWVQNVAASGTFVKASGMNDWTTGINGIPTGWTIENE